MPMISRAISPPTPYCILMGYVGGMNSETCESGNASAVTITVAHTAPDAPRLGKISRTLDFVTVEAAEATGCADAATAVAQVSVFTTVLGKASCATRRGYLNFTFTICDTRPENMPANACG